MKNLNHFSAFIKEEKLNINFSNGTIGFSWTKTYKHHLLQEKLGITSRENIKKEKI